MKNIYAHTDPFGNYPGYISINECDNSVRITVRSPGDNGVHVATLEVTRARLIMMARAILGQTCMVPPVGWFCTREATHEGPCAAHPAVDPLFVTEPV